MATNMAARTVAILLAAGRSERFGAGDKLAAPFLGRPLACHAAETLAGIGFARRLAVARVGEGPDFSDFGFEMVEVEVGAPLSASLRAGVAAAGDRPFLVALADMPLVPAKHFRRLLDAHEGGVTATGREGRPMVPAVFDAGLGGAIMALAGDRGAQALLAEAALVEARPEWLADIDTPEELAEIEQRARQG